MMSWKEMVCEKAMELAEQRFDANFYDLPEETQMKLMDDAADYLVSTE